MSAKALIGRKSTANVLLRAGQTAKRIAKLTAPTDHRPLVLGRV